MQMTVVNVFYADNRATNPLFTVNQPDSFLSYLTGDAICFTNLFEQDNAARFETGNRLLNIINKPIISTGDSP